MAADGPVGVLLVSLRRTALVRQLMHRSAHNRGASSHLDGLHMYNPLNRLAANGAIRHIRHALRAGTEVAAVQDDSVRRLVQANDAGFVFADPALNVRTNPLNVCADRIGLCLPASERG